MVGPPGSACHPSLYRPGLFVQRFQDSTDSTSWCEPFAARRLEAVANCVDLLAGDRDAGSFGGHVRQMAGRCGTEKSDVCFGDLLSAWVLCFLLRRRDSSVMAALLRIWNHRRCRPRSWLHLPGFNFD